MHTCVKNWDEKNVINCKIGEFEKYSWGDEMQTNREQEAEKHRNATET